MYSANGSPPRSAMPRNGGCQRLGRHAKWKPRNEKAAKCTSGDVDALPIRRSAKSTARPDSLNPPRSASRDFIAVHEKRTIFGHSTRSQRERGFA